MFVDLKSRALSCDPSVDRVMSRAEVSVRVQASQGNITVLRLFLTIALRILSAHNRPFATVGHVTDNF